MNDSAISYIGFIFQSPLKEQLPASVEVLIPTVTCLHAHKPPGTPFISASLSSVSKTWRIFPCDIWQGTTHHTKDKVIYISQISCLHSSHLSLKTTLWIGFFNGWVILIKHISKWKQRNQKPEASILSVQWRPMSLVNIACR